MSESSTTTIASEREVDALVARIAALEAEMKILERGGASGGWSDFLELDFDKLNWGRVRKALAASFAANLLGFAPWVIRVIFDRQVLGISQISLRILSLDEWTAGKILQLCRYRAAFLGSCCCRGQNTLQMEGGSLQ